MTPSYHHGDLRNALLNAAETILNRDGLNALTLRAAAREAGVSHGAPAHHFGDLTGLLTALAASGFIRLRQHLVDETADATRETYVFALGNAYVRFARTYPGIFLLMFRSERLDWTSHALSTAGGSAFELLTGSQAGDEYDRDNAKTLINASRRWSLMHGLATLVLDGQLTGMANKVKNINIETLIASVLTDEFGARP